MTDAHTPDRDDESVVTDADDEDDALAYVGEPLDDEDE